MKLADLMKKFGLQAKEERAEVELKETQELTEMLAVLEANEVAMNEAQAQIESLKAELAGFAEEKAQAEAAAAQAAADALKAKMDARMAILSEEFGDEKAAKLSSVIEKMEDAEFSAVFGVQKALAAKEEESFAEQGVDAKAESVEKQPTHFKQFIKKETK